MSVYSSRMIKQGIRRGLYHYAETTELIGSAPQTCWFRIMDFRVVRGIMQGKSLQTGLWHVVTAVEIR